MFSSCNKTQVVALPPYSRITCCKTGFAIISSRQCLAGYLLPCFTAIVCHHNSETSVSRVRNSYAMLCIFKIQCVKKYFRSMIGENRAPVFSVIISLKHISRRVNTQQQNGRVIERCYGTELRIFSFNGNRIGMPCFTSVTGKAIHTIVGSKPNGLFAAHL